MADNLLQTTIYHNLRQQLFAGDIEPGCRLSEQQLAEDFQASRMPVRQALARLAHEGMITQSSRVRSAVIDPTLHDLQEAVELRVLLEPHAASLAAASIRWVDLETLGAACRQMVDLAAKVRRSRRFTEEDRQAELLADLTFHRTIWQAAARPRLAKLCDDLHLIMRIGLPLTAGSLGDDDPMPLKHAAQCHQRIDAAIRRGDGDAAAAEMKRHVEGNRASLQRLARQLGEG